MYLCVYVYIYAVHTPTGGVHTGTAVYMALATGLGP
jgi:hypothetical protein